MKIRIKNLALKTVVGTHSWERLKAQAVLINIEMELDGTKAVRTDSIQNAADYRALTKEVIRTVEGARYYLLESLAYRILQTVLRNSRIRCATVEVDKPGALRFAESVSVAVSGEGKRPRSGTVKGRKKPKG